MKKNQKITVISVLVLIGLATTWLFYNQATGKFVSDLTSHIANALNKNSPSYSLTSIIYNLLYNYVGGKLAIAVFLSIVTILTIDVTKKVLEYYMKSENEFLIWIYAILLNFAIAIYVPFIYPRWNVGVQEGNEWHNSTYICMKLLGMIALLIYFKIEKKYLKKIEIPEYILFCLILILVNSVKPNFIVVFAPTMLIFLIIDFFKNIKNKKSIMNIIIFGCAVLISLPVLIFQSCALYGEDSESGIAISFLALLKHYHKYPVFSIIQSAAFPIFIILTNLKAVIKERKYLFIVVLNIVALIEYLFLIETGERAWDANFSWGYSFSLFMAFLISVTILYNSEKEERKYKETYFTIGYTLLALHILIGINFFIKLLMGFNYTR